MPAIPNTKMNYCYLPTTITTIIIFWFLFNRPIFLELIWVSSHLQRSDAPNQKHWKNCSEYIFIVLVQEIIFIQWIYNAITVTTHDTVTVFFYFHISEIFVYYHYFWLLVGVPEGKIVYIKTLLNIDAGGSAQ